jgi:methionyl aminopeptidase
MSIESGMDWKGLREVGRVVRLALEAMRSEVVPALSTAEIDRVGARVLSRNGARHPARAELGFPGACCISVDDEVVHGVPGPRVMRPGDLVKLDAVVEKGGCVADAAITVRVPPVTPLKKRVIACATRGGRRCCTRDPRGRVRDLGRAIEAEVRRHGFGVLPELAGHGTGRRIREWSIVPNHEDRDARDVLTGGS